MNESIKAVYYGEWTTLGELQPGAIFETKDGRRWATAPLPGDRIGVVPLSGTGPGLETLPFAVAVRTIDLDALLEDVAALSMILHDRRLDGDNSYWAEHGAHVERGEVLRLLRGEALRIGTSPWPIDSNPGKILLELAARIEQRGPALPQFAPEQLSADNAHLRKALESIEWGGTDINNLGACFDACPSCKQRKTEGHALTCQIAGPLGRTMS